jgi:hypothetical protein
MNAGDFQIQDLARAAKSLPELSEFRFQLGILRR